MDLGIKDRVAIVAASSQGLGRAIAFGLAREGARLALCARTENTLAATAAAIRSETGAEVLALPVDVTRAEQVHEFVRRTIEQFGRLDICVTNSGGPPARSFAQTSEEDWRAAVNLNLMSTLHFAREVLPLMQARRWGRLLAITSASVKQPIAGLILSTAVRSAVNGLVKSLANEYGPFNVLVNNICPGYTATARVEELSAAMAAAEGIEARQVVERWAAQVPLGRLGRPEELADLVVFLASERASYINGVSIAVDGGLVKGIY